MCLARGSGWRRCESKARTSGDASRRGEQTREKERKRGRKGSQKNVSAFTDPEAGCESGESCLRILNDCMQDQAACLPSQGNHWTDGSLFRRTEAERERQSERREQHKESSACGGQPSPHKCPHMLSKHLSWILRMATTIAAADAAARRPVTDGWSQSKQAHSAKSMQTWRAKGSSRHIRIQRIQAVSPSFCQRMQSMRLARSHARSDSCVAETGRQSGREKAGRRPESRRMQMFSGQRVCVREHDLAFKAQS